MDHGRGSYKKKKEMTTKKKKKRKKRVSTMKNKPSRHATRRQRSNKNAAPTSPFSCAVINF